MTDNTAALGWLMNDLVERVVGVRHAILLSVDGLLMARSEGLPRADAEHLSAVGSAFRSLSHGAGRRFGLGGVRQTVVELETAYLLVAEAGSSTRPASTSPARPEQRPPRPEPSERFTCRFEPWRPRPRSVRGAGSRAW